jgi:hypothetical protein
MLAWCRCVAPGRPAPPHRARGNDDVACARRASCSEIVAILRPAFGRPPRAPPHHTTRSSIPGTARATFAAFRGVARVETDRARPDFHTAPD